MKLVEFKTNGDYRAWLKRNGSGVKIISVARGADESYAVTFAQRISIGGRIALVFVLGIVAGFIALAVYGSRLDARSAEMDGEVSKANHELRKLGVDVRPTSSHTVRLVQAVTLGATVVQPGTKLQFVSREGNGIRIEYANQDWIIPTYTTDLNR